MKNELMMASLLTVTAGAASQAIYPNYAYAASKLSEKKLAKEVLFKILAPARLKNSEGSYSQGHIYLRIHQEKSTPSYPNQLRAEMQGAVYFESDIEDREFSDGRKFKTFWPLYGDDGAVLLDRIDADKDAGNTYQVYGCSSTSVCATANLTVSIVNGEATLNGGIDQGEQIEILQKRYNNQTQQTTEHWTTHLWSVETVQVPFKD